MKHERQSFSSLEEDTAEYLAVEIDGQIHAIAIRDVQEIRPSVPATPMPLSAPTLLGLINLRGTILPIIDLPQMLDAAPCTEPSMTVIVADHARQAGLIVDAVCDILTLPNASLHDAARFSGSSSPCISAISNHDERMIPVLDITACLEIGLTR